MSAASDNDRPRKPIRRSGRWRWVWAIAGTVFASLIGYLVWTVFDREWTKSTGERALAESRAKVEATDPDWSWERHSAKRQKPPAEKNGADLIPAVKKRVRPEWGKEFTKEEWKPLMEVEPNVRYSPGVIEQARRELTDSADAVQLARTMKEHPFGHRELVLKPNPIETLLPDTQDTRLVADLLRWDVVLATEDGDARRAADDLLALLNTARSIGDEPTMISQLVRIAIRAITVNAIERCFAQNTSPPNLVELQAALTAEAEEPLLLYGVRGERAMTDRLFENMQKDVVRPDDLSKGATGNNPLGGLGWWRYRANLPAEHAFALEWLSKYVEIAKRPVHEQPPLIAAIPEPPNDGQHVLTRLLLPAVDRVAHAHWRSTAQLRCAVAGIACERFRQQHKRWPNALNELVPAFLPAVPLDPFDGQPLRYSKWEDGVVVYSVGKRSAQRNGFPAPVEVPKPGFPEGIEYGFRLWDADKRRIPPLPDPPPPPKPDNELPP